MIRDFQGWPKVAKLLLQRANDPSIQEQRLNQGQRASLRAIADKIVKNGVLIADEVGMGKTRIAVEVAHAVTQTGGRVAILVPPGLGYQWQAELRVCDITLAGRMVRSLFGYLSAWEADDEAMRMPWFDEPVVMISHAFANFRFGERSRSWRWPLLPELYAHWERLRYGRWPRFYHDNDDLRDLWAERAASSITAGIRKTLTAQTEPWRFMNELALIDNWTKLLDPAEYGTGGRWRDQFERGVGLGLGLFDLIILDEAHKSRTKDSGLSRLLGNVILPTESARRVALTATPIELDVKQWTGTLNRLELDDQVRDKIQKSCEAYADAVRALREGWPAGSEEGYIDSARRFESALSPYLIRRDKREDPDILRFQECSKEAIHEYRRETEVRVESEDLDEPWRMAVCAAEALSFVARQKSDPVAKRLRLTLGSGYGLAAWLAEHQRDEQADAHQERGDEDAAKDRGESPKEIRAPNVHDERRIKRAQWWKEVISNAFTPAQPDSNLFHHPAILTAAREIENETAKGEKVLVFGRFTKPMKALVDLLNAQEMLRRVETKNVWPEAGIHQEDRPVVEAAFKQLKARGLLAGLESIDQAERDLEKSYAAERRRRERFREGLIAGIEHGINDAPRRIRGLFNAFKNSVRRKSTRNEQGELALVARALMESESIDSNRDLAPHFQDLVMALTDRESTEDHTEEQDEEAEKDDWSNIVERLNEEYATRRGGFARLMYGGTTQHSRRMIQLAFNRPYSFPKVLVAQSMVGREGLNLHEACRIVVFLHPEWNPGVVEQQIGRVDRLGSRWSKELEKAIRENWPLEKLPRIEIRPIIFRGTYDEYNWKVLKDRWDTLRSQLHGIVIPEKEARNDGELRERLRKINAVAPCFSPNRDAVGQE